LQACAADGACTAAGAASSTAGGVLTLSGYNLNRLSWSAVTGAASYKIRRDVGGATQGVIWSGTALTVDDTGLAGDGSAKPTVDGTGTLTGRGVFETGTTVAPGTGTATARVGGALYVWVGSAATTGTAEQTLATYTLPANSLSSDMKALRITTWATTAANTNAKTLKVVLGSATVATTTTSASALGISQEVLTVRSASGEQISRGVSTMNTASGGAGVHTGLVTTTATTETDTSAIVITVKATTGSAAGDLTLRGFIVEAVN
jgi:hypothetical protein